jgi:CHAD domain-containing protein
LKAPDLDENALRHSQATVARQVSQVQFETLLIAAQPLLAGDAADVGGKGLHDFRVALRRLRSTLRAWYPGHPLPQKPRRRLKKLSRLGGKVRDLELKLAELEELCKDHEEMTTTAAVSLVATLEPEHMRLQRKFHRRLCHRLPKISRALQQGLLAEPTTTQDGLAASAALREMVRQQWESTAAALNAISDADQVGEAHRGRIAAKRLRYLLEPLAAASKDAAKAVQQLTRLQDHLGDLHDAHLLHHSLHHATDRQPRIEPLECASEQRVQDQFMALRPLLNDAFRTQLRTALTHTIRSLEPADTATRARRRKPGRLITPATRS